MAEHWRELVTTAMLGTDRRDPPPAVGPLADVVADTVCVRRRPSGCWPRSLRAPPFAAPACCRARRSIGSPVPPPTTVRRARRGVDAGVTSVSWPVLEDEWMLTLITNGWRIAPGWSRRAVAASLRSRPARARRGRLRAAGPWLVSHLPELGGPIHPGAVDPEALGELPDLPIPPDLIDLLGAPADIGAGSPT